MKSFFALAAAASLALVSAEDCDLVKLAPLLTDSDVRTCGTETGLSPPTPPSATILPKLCDNTFCKAALAKLKALNVGDCVALGYHLETDFINPIEKYCAGAAAPTSAPTTGPTTAPTPGSPSVAPTPTSGTPTTQKPGC